METNEKKERKNKIAIIWDTFEKYTPIFLLITMSVIIVAQVFFRYVVGSSLRWAEEVGRFLLIAITFIGSAYAFKRGTHVSVEAVVNMLPSKIAFMVHIFSRIASIIFFGILLVYGYEYAMNNINHLAPATRISVSIPYMAIPIGSIMIIIRLVILTIQELKRGVVEGEQIEGITETYSD